MFLKKHHIYRVDHVLRLFKYYDEEEFDLETSDPNHSIVYDGIIEEEVINLYNELTIDNNIEEEDKNEDEDEDEEDQTEEEQKEAEGKSSTNNLIKPWEITWKDGVIHKYAGYIRINARGEIINGIKLHKEIMNAVHSKHLGILLSKSKPVDRIRLESISQTTSWTPLIGQHSSYDSHIINDAYKHYLRHRMGLEPLSGLIHCENCDEGDNAYINHKSHWSACRKTGSHKIQRHNAIVRAMHYYFLGSDIVSTYEPQKPIITRTIHEPFINREHPDIQVSFYKNGKLYIFFADISVTDNTAPSYIKRNQSAEEIRYKQKVKKYTKFTELIKEQYQEKINHIIKNPDIFVEFYPFVISTFGSIHPDSFKMLQKIAHKVHLDRQLTTPKEWLKELLEIINAKLINGNWYMIKDSINKSIFKNCLEDQ